MNFISNTEKQRQEMLKSIGVKSIDELFADVPKQKILKKQLNLPSALSEKELLEELSSIAAKNANARTHKYFIGAGLYNRFIPSIVPHLVFRSEFYTSYTPYQAEASQGMLQAIYEFQSLVCSLTGMDAANASMYDGATALAEAVIMAKNISEKKEVLVAANIHPEYRAVLETYCWANSLAVKEIEFDNKKGTVSIEKLKKEISENTACFISQSPNFFGCIEDLAAIEKIVHAKKALFIVSVVEPSSLGLLEAPGTLGADIVVAEGQSLGSTLNFGGPGVGWMATKEEFLRHLPGRICGETVDLEGKRGFILTLQAREQHIRREKAASNICTNQALVALANTVYLSALGKSGFKRLAEINLQLAHYLAGELRKTRKAELVFSAPFYNEFVVMVKESADRFQKKLEEKGFIAGVPLGENFKGMENCLLLCATEMNSREQIDELIAIVKGL
ncbi:MAG: aminomethyl-transferring glycine dehydrogenase subunit GcvPA [Candidatus Diapherotrites archaeon]